MREEPASSRSGHLMTSSKTFAAISQSARDASRWVTRRSVTASMAVTSTPRGTAAATTRRGPALESGDHDVGAHGRYPQPAAAPRASQQPRVVVVLGQARIRASSATSPAAARIPT